MRRLSLLFQVLSVISVAGALAGVVLGPEWIEELTGFEPDGGNGSLEFLIVVLPAALAVGLGWLGHVTAQRAKA